MATKKQKRAKLKMVDRPEQWAAGLAAFRKRHKLTWRDLSAACQGTISARSLHRLCVHGVEPRFIHELRPEMCAGLRVFLESKNLNPSKVTAELRSIFCKQEVHPVLTQRAVLPKAAQQFFRLSRDPFTGDPQNVGEVFITDDFKLCLAHIMESVEFQGFNALIADVGAGKTTVKRCAVDICNGSNGKKHILWPSFMNMEKVHSGSIASFILRYFGETAPRDLVARAERVKNLLVRLAEDNVKVALGFDECHHLDPRLLTALKNFWELGDGGFDRYIGLVLFGQLRFGDTLNLPEFREISERLNIIRLPSLGKHAKNYLEHRLALAGSKLERLFEPAAVTRMLKIANTPLALGNVANSALLKAFDAREKVVVAEFLSDKNSDPDVFAITPSK